MSQKQICHYTLHLIFVDHHALNLPYFTKSTVIIPWYSDRYFLDTLMGTKQWIPNSYTIVLTQFSDFRTTMCVFPSFWWLNCNYKIRKRIIIKIKKDTIKHFTCTVCIYFTKSLVSLILHFDNLLFLSFYMDQGSSGRWMGVKGLT